MLECYPENHMRTEFRGTEIGINEMLVEQLGPSLGAVLKVFDRFADHHKAAHLAKAVLETYKPSTTPPMYQESDPNFPWKALLEEANSPGMWLAGADVKRLTIVGNGNHWWQESRVLAISDTHGPVLVVKRRHQYVVFSYESHHRVEHDSLDEAPTHCIHILTTGQAISDERGPIWSNTIYQPRNFGRQKRRQELPFDQ